MSDNRFEWSESGIRLLETIHQIIAKNGGMEPMYAKVLKEISPDPHRPNKRETIEKIRLLASVLSVKKISQVLGIPAEDVYLIMKEENIPFKGKPNSNKKNENKEIP